MPLVVPVASAAGPLDAAARPARLAIGWLLSAASFLEWSLISLTVLE